jgi:hypothetical protein
MTRQECETHIVHGQEKALQTLCAQWLTLHGIYFECDKDGASERAASVGGPISASVTVAIGCPANVRSPANP